MASLDAGLARVFALSAMTREQYVQRCKENAIALLRDGRIGEAVASMMMDMRKHPDCGVPRGSTIQLWPGTRAGAATVFATSTMWSPV